jgi:uncharacterized membrane protein HdeD (DUF308 family)
VKKPHPSIIYMFCGVGFFLSGVAHVILKHADQKADHWAAPILFGFMAIALIVKSVANSASRITGRDT